jgi:hypothetical protein
MSCRVSHQVDIIGHIPGVPLIYFSVLCVSCKLVVSARVLIKLRFDFLFIYLLASNIVCFYHEPYIWMSFCLQSLIIVAKIYC